ncbi:MAG: carbon-monoxide dehydrogenase large subunit [Gammaproteobacteria bacterium]|jgi:carbon-monoxide dehydrogenase large subunit
MMSESLKRIEDQRFLTGAARYAADCDEDNQLYAVVVRAEHAHATLSGISTDAASRIDGVVAIHTAQDLMDDGIHPLPSATELADGSKAIAPPRYALARDRVRHVGDPIAVVLAHTRAAALAGAEEVVVDYTPLPAVVDAAAAFADNAIDIWPQAPGNLAFEFQAGDRQAVRTAIASATHVIELELSNHRVSAVPLEPRSGLATYDPDTGQFELTASAQGLHTIKRMVATVFGLPEAHFRLRAPDVGGGFGLKNFLYPEWILLLWAARRHARPVKWVADRGEEFSAAAHGRDVHTNARLALDAQGRFLALEADVTANLGAYLPGGGPLVTTRAMPTAMGGMYRIDCMHMHVRGAFTNTAPVDAYRGAGKPEANYIIERLIDTAARRCGFDAVQLRRLNAFSSFPHRTALGMNVDGGRFAANLSQAMKSADQPGFEARRADSAAHARLRGFGVGCFLETARATPEEGAELRFTDDETVEIRVGTESNGQGHETAYAQIVTAHLGVAMDQLRYIQADTGAVRMGHGHGGARSMHMGGAALVRAMELVLDKARPIAASMLQVSADQLSFEEGCFTVRSANTQVSLMQVAAAARDAFDTNATPDLRGLDTFAKVEDAPFTFPNGCHVAEVEVDADTGHVRLLSYCCVDDYGALVNPMLVEGQVHGGVAQGIGQALFEHIAYDPESGQLLSGSLMDYALPAADGLPNIQVDLQGVATNANPLGVKGSGQAGAIAAAQTVMNAVMDALSTLGVEHLDMPATPQRVWRAIEDARGGRNRLSTCRED